MFGGLFDFNREGKVDAGEFAVGMAILEGIEDAGLNPDDYDF